MPKAHEAGGVLNPLEAVVTTRPTVWIMTPCCGQEFPIAVNDDEGPFRCVCGVWYKIPKAKEHD